MKRRTILMLVISIISVLGASTLVYNALTPEDTNYEALSDGSVLENTSPTAYSIETEVPSDTLPEIMPDVISEVTSAPPVINEGIVTTAPPAATNNAGKAATTAPPSTTAAAQAPASPRAAQTLPPTQTTTAASKSGNAPDFTIYDSGGNAVHLKDFAGRPVVINFWASWCGPCKAEMPEFQSMYNRYSGSIVFLMINLTDGSRETKESATSFLNTNGYTFPAYFDTKKSASTAYGISSIPSTFFISKEGDIKSRQIGQISASALENGLKSIQ